MRDGFVRDGASLESRCVLCMRDFGKGGFGKSVYHMAAHLEDASCRACFAPTSWSYDIEESELGCFGDPKTASCMPRSSHNS